MKVHILKKKEKLQDNFLIPHDSCWWQDWWRENKCSFKHIKLTNIRHNRWNLTKHMIAQGDNQIFSRIQALVAYLSINSTLVHN